MPELFDRLAHVLFLAAFATGEMRLLRNSAAAGINSTSIGKCYEPGQPILFAIRHFGFARFLLALCLFVKLRKWRLFVRSEMRCVVRQLDPTANLDQSEVFQPLLIPATRGLHGCVCVARQVLRR